MRSTVRNETQNKYMFNFFIGNYLCIPSTNFPFLFKTFEFEFAPGKHLTRVELFLYDILPWTLQKGIAHLTFAKKGEKVNASPVTFAEDFTQINKKDTCFPFFVIFGTI